MAGDVIRIDLDVRQLVGPLDVIQTQAPFIFALALTRTAQDVQGEIKGTLGDHFEIRRNWVARGIRFTPAKKTHLSAEVGSVDEFMRAHGVGETVTPKAGSKAMAIPVPGGGRPTPEAQTPERTWPSRILGKANQRSFSRFARKKAGKRVQRAKPSPFVARINDRLGVYIRAGKERFPIKALWLFREKIQQPRDWPFIEEVQTTVNRVWASNVVKATEKALATAIARPAP